MAVRGRRTANVKKRRKKHPVRILFLILFVLILAAAAANFLYMFFMDGRFYHNTTLNGYDVSGKTAEETVALLKDPYNSLTLQITEQGETVLSVSFRDMGYSVSDEELLSSVEDMIRRQNGFALISTLIGGNYGMRVPFTVDQASFQAAVCADSLTTARAVTKDAALTREADGSYVITPEVYGNDFSDADLQNLVRETITESLKNAALGNTITVAIPESIYRQPSVFSSDETLVKTRDLYNQYSKASITYTFGEETVTLDWDTIQGWITEDGSIDEDSVYTYVTDLAAQYDTIYVTRVFQTTGGDYVTLPSNDYGYQIDVDAEFSQLLSDIQSNAAATREPIYAIEGYSRNGVDDLNGSYVEVDLTSQHLWFYKNGELVVETDVVTGMPTEERETVQGAFAIPYKASPFNLKGGGSDENSSDSWDVTVQYWMPFHDGQGLHDASWRSSFGGTIYQTGGSHGCVNLPTDAAAIIYEYMEENMPIILYKEG